jgi:hypothetical protein
MRAESMKMLTGRCWSWCLRRQAPSLAGKAPMTSGSMRCTAVYMRTALYMCLYMCLAGKAPMTSGSMRCTAYCSIYVSALYMSLSSYCYIYIVICVLSNMCPRTTIYMRVLGLLYICLQYKESATNTDAKELLGLDCVQR